MSDSKRAANITVTEKNILLELVERYAAIVENKETDKVSGQAKGQAWERISAEFNGIAANKRSAEQLKQAYNNIKKNAKKAAAKKKFELFKTGGGPAVNDSAPHESLEERVLALLGNRATPLSNPFDCDAAYNAELISDVVQINNEEELNKFPVGSVVVNVIELLSSCVASSSASTGPSCPPVMTQSIGQTCEQQQQQQQNTGPSGSSVMNQSIVQTAKQQQQQQQQSGTGQSGSSVVSNWSATTSQQPLGATTILLTDDTSSQSATTSSIAKFTADSRSKSWAGRRRPRPNAVNSAVTFTKIAALADSEKDYYTQKLKHAVRMRVLLLQEQFEIKRLKTLEE